MQWLGKELLNSLILYYMWACYGAQFIHGDLRVWDLVAFTMFMADSLREF